ncbi:MAG: WD40 repeat domain-containing protein [Pirellulales bacterium]
MTRVLIVPLFLLAMFVHHGRTCCGAEPTVPVTNASEANAPFAGHTQAVTAAAFSPDGKTIITGSDDRTARIWDADSGTLQSTIKETAREGYGGPVYAFSGDLKMMAVNYWGSVTIYSLPDGKSIKEIDPLLDRNQKSTFRPDVYGMAFSPDAKSLVTAGSKAGQGLPGGLIVVWNLETGKHVHVFNSLETAAGSVVWSADGKMIATGTNGVGGELPSAGEVLVWDAVTGQPMRTFKVKLSVEYGEWASAGDVTFSADSKRIAVPVTAGSRSAPAGLIVPESGASIRVWDLSNGTSGNPVSGLKPSITRVLFSPDGSLLVGACTDNHIRIWHSTSGKELQSESCPDKATAIAFSPDGSKLVVGCKNGHVSIVQIKPAS